MSGLHVEISVRTTASLQNPDLHDDQGLLGDRIFGDAEDTPGRSTRHVATQGVVVKHLVHYGI